MPSLPLPFVGALLLAILCARLVAGGEPGRRITPPLVFVAACTLDLIVVGLRWSTDLAAIRALQPVVAATLPPLAWLCFARLAQPRRRARWPHLLPVALVALLSAVWTLWKAPIDGVLAAIFLGYAAALLRLAARGPDALAAARLDDAPKAIRSIRLVGLVLASFALVDLAIAVDVALSAGRHAALIVAAANLIALPAGAWAIATTGLAPPQQPAAPTEPPQAKTAQDDEPPADEDDLAEDQAIIDRLDALMQDRAPYRDPDLTLDRLARRLGLPARRLSAAVNRRLDRNVSQLVNDHRVAEACRLLSTTDDPVTRIMFDAGFQTKSNFNREFRRVTGTTPSAWRRDRRGAGDGVA
ncbi:helix-turn-helix domain-containing protein [Tistrella mobilis]|uniref:helix-turn-helix domain-containing protein n=1 Tax=Tistrella mobilis TaxID=171437 RepID=UPI0035583EBC